MQSLKLKPAYKDYIWGGTKLKSEFNKDTPYARTAESWELSAHKDGMSVIAGGEHDGKKLSAVLTAETLGTRCNGALPVLIKLIDAADNLSVQVHPSDAYARAHENDNGKTEMWYVADAEKDAGIYCGFKKPVTKDELAAKIMDGTLTEVLNFIPCVKGDSFFIPAGTVHAIGKGLTICEVQQSSNVTYRLYDFGRVGADGKPRELHIAKALEVADLGAYTNFAKKAGHDGGDYSSAVIAECGYFRVEEVRSQKGGNLTADDKSFVSAAVIDGGGMIAGQAVQKGDTVFIPAGYGNFSFSGVMNFLLVRA